jgi:hypothetical protein
VRRLGAAPTRPSVPPCGGGSRLRLSSGSAAGALARTRSLAWLPVQAGGERTSCIALDGSPPSRAPHGRRTPSAGARWLPASDCDPRSPRRRASLTQTCLAMSDPSPRRIPRDWLAVTFSADSRHCQMSWLRERRRNAPSIKLHSVTGSRAASDALSFPMSPSSAAAPPNAVLACL